MTQPLREVGGLAAGRLVDERRPTLPSVEVELVEGEQERFGPAPWLVRCGGVVDGVVDRYGPEDAGIEAVRVGVGQCRQIVGERRDRVRVAGVSEGDRAGAHQRSIAGRRAGVRLEPACGDLN